MSINPNIVEKIKTLCQEKGGITERPENGVEAVVIKEERIRNSYTAEIAVGTISSINVRYFECQGKVFDERLNQFTDANIRIEPKVVAQTKGMEYLCAVFTEPSIVRKVDEASWAGNFQTLADLTKVLEEY